MQLYCNRLPSSPHLCIDMATWSQPIGAGTGLDVAQRPHTGVRRDPGKVPCEFPSGLGGNALPGRTVWLLKHDSMFLGRRWEVRVGFSGLQAEGLWANS